MATLYKKEMQLSFDDVLLIPQPANIESRSLIDLTPKPILDFNLKLPFIASPMTTVSEHEMAMALGELGCLAIIHRYNSIEQQADICKKILNVPYGAALGVQDTIERAEALYKIGCRLFCVDVAHGHNMNVKNAVKALQNWGNNKGIHIMAGNIATSEGFSALIRHGADSIRVGIGPGSICETQVQTGHGMPQLSSLMDIQLYRQYFKNIEQYVVADGGIKNSGDATKALAFGADYLMMGSIFSGTDEAPGIFYHLSDGTKVKSYIGMAAKESQISWKGTFSSLEGIASYTKYKGSVKDVVSELERGVRSGLSYSGCRDLQDFMEHSLYITRSNSSIVEGKGHHVNTR